MIQNHQKLRFAMLAVALSLGIPSSAHPKTFFDTKTTAGTAAVVTSAATIGLATALITKILQRGKRAKSLIALSQLHRSTGLTPAQSKKRIRLLLEQQQNKGSLAIRNLGIASGVGVVASCAALISFLLARKSDDVAGSQEVTPETQGSANPLADRPSIKPVDRTKPFFINIGQTKGFELEDGKRAPAVDILYECQGTGVFDHNDQPVVNPADFDSIRRKILFTPPAKKVKPRTMGTQTRLGTLPPITKTESDHIARLEKESEQLREQLEKQKMQARLAEERRQEFERQHNQLVIKYQAEGPQSLSLINATPNTPQATITPRTPETLLETPADGIVNELADAQIHRLRLEGDVMSLRSQLHAQALSPVRPFDISGTTSRKRGLDALDLQTPDRPSIKSRHVHFQTPDSNPSHHPGDDLVDTPEWKRAEYAAAAASPDASPQSLDEWGGQSPSSSLDGDVESYYRSDGDHSPRAELMDREYAEGEQRSDGTIIVSDKKPAPPLASQVQPSDRPVGLGRRAARRQPVEYTPNTQKRKETFRGIVGTGLLMDNGVIPEPNQPTLAQTCSQQESGSSRVVSRRTAARAAQPVQPALAPIAESEQPAEQPSSARSLAAESSTSTLPAMDGGVRVVTPGNPPREVALSTKQAYEISTQSGSAAAHHAVETHLKKVASAPPGGGITPTHAQGMKGSSVLPTPVPSQKAVVNLADASPAVVSAFACAAPPPKTPEALRKARLAAKAQRRAHARPAGDGASVGSRGSGLSRTSKISIESRASGYSCWSRRSCNKRADYAPGGTQFAKEHKQLASSFLSAKSLDERIELADEVVNLYRKAFDAAAQLSFSKGDTTIPVYQDQSAWHIAYPGRGAKISLFSSKGNHICDATVTKVVRRKGGDPLSGTNGWYIGYPTTILYSVDGKGSKTHSLTINKRCSDGSHLIGWGYRNEAERLKAREKLADKVKEQVINSAQVLAQTTSIS